jgi:hypothetical protein
MESENRLPVTSYQDLNFDLSVIIGVSQLFGPVTGNRQPVTALFITTFLISITPILTHLS